MTRRDKTILWIGLPLFLLAVGVAGTFEVLSLDAPPPDDSDLLPHRQPLPDEQNAYGLFEEAYGRLEADLTEAQRRFVSDVVDEEYDAAKAEEILRAAEPALALWRKGLERPGLQAPPIKGPGTLMPYVTYWLGLAQLADLRALHLARQGKGAEATETALGIVHFGRMAMHSHGCLLTYMFGVTIEERGLARVRSIAGDAHLDRETITRALEQVTPESPVGLAFAEAMRLEYALLARMIEDWKVGRFGSGLDEPNQEREEVCDFFLQVNRTKRLFADYLHPFVTQAREPFAKVSLPQPPEAPVRDLGSILWAHATGNAAGRMLLVMLSGYDGSFEEKCRRSVHVHATRLLLALKAYKQKTGRLPDRLDALVPEYLDAVPRDGFDGQPFRYDRDESILYSVGPNLTDDGGDSRPQDEPAETDEVPPAPEREDLVFRVPPE